MQMLEKMNGAPCACGKIHSFSAKIHSGSGVIQKLPGILADLGVKKPFLLCDCNTYKAAGAQVEVILQQAGVIYSAYCFENSALKPDENSVGSAVMHFDHSCDGIVAVGSGVINDIGKILSATSKKPYVIVATAPSMDGYASATSSMTRDGLKISLPSCSADVIVGDTDILRQAPLHMMRAGIGDMLAKYVSICEWRISNLINGEYYCHQVAELVRKALQRCVSHADGLLNRQPEAVQAVFEGLVIGGVAMNYAGLSRPASGVEHYISHVLDMRAVEFGWEEQLHGIQCAYGTLQAVKLYEKLMAMTPDREKALCYVKAFDYDAWCDQLRSLLGRSAISMIELEKREGKYNVNRHAARLEKLIANWDGMKSIVREELPTVHELQQLMEKLQLPTKLSQLGTDEDKLPLIFAATKDIRDKYVLSHLAWDLGVIDELIE